MFFAASKIKQFGEHGGRCLKNFNAKEAESEGSRIWGEPGLHNKAQSPKKKKKKI